jgi:hypothetical protein
VTERQEALNRAHNALEGLHQHIAELGCRGKKSKLTHYQTAVVGGFERYP